MFLKELAKQFFLNATRREVIRVYNFPGKVVDTALDDGKILPDGTLFIPNNGEQLVVSSQGPVKLLDDPNRKQAVIKSKHGVMYVNESSTQDGEHGRISKDLDGARVVYSRR
ncbi:MAG TPA: hypothetical protein VF189_02200 [Patescibacteria group bacterium]